MDRSSGNSGAIRAFINPYPRRPWMQDVGAAAPSGQTKGLKGNLMRWRLKKIAFSYSKVFFQESLPVELRAALKFVLRIQLNM